MAEKSLRYTLISLEEAGKISAKDIAMISNLVREKTTMVEPSYVDTGDEVMAAPDDSQPKSVSLASLIETCLRDWASAHGIPLPERPQIGQHEYGQGYTSHTHLLDVVKGQSHALVRLRLKWTG
jgi:hypothetical protein